MRACDGLLQWSPECTDSSPGIISTFKGLVRSPLTLKAFVLRAMSDATIPIENEVKSKSSETSGSMCQMPTEEDHGRCLRQKHQETQEKILTKVFPISSAMRKHHHAPCVSKLASLALLLTRPPTRLRHAALHDISRHESRLWSASPAVIQLHHRLATAWPRVNPQPYPILQPYTLRHQPFQ